MTLILDLCPEEDSPNCAWIGDHSGNGDGLSFVDIDGTVYYADSQVATDFGWHLYFDEYPYDASVYNSDAEPYVEYDPDLDMATVYHASSYKEAYDLIAAELNCVDAKPALDQISHHSWWGYCEPALADSETVSDPDDYTPHVDPPAVGPHQYDEVVITPTSPTTDTLAETGANDLSPVIAVMGIVLVIAGLVAIHRSNRIRH